MFHLRKKGDKPAEMPSNKKGYPEEDLFRTEGAGKKKIENPKGKKKIREAKSLTEEQRIENAKIMNYYLGAIIGIAAAYIFGYTGYILTEENGDLFSALSVVMECLRSGRYFFPVTPGSAAGMAAGIAAGAVAIGFMQLDYKDNYSYKADEVAGTGGFMSKKDLKTYKARYTEEEGTYKDPVTGEPMPDASPNMIFSKECKRSFNDELTGLSNNVLIIGGTGTGKTYGYIKPNILQMNASFVVTDPAGEIVRDLGWVLRDHGYKIKVFNLIDMKHSNTYNPFNYINGESDVKVLVDCFIKNTTEKDEGKGEKFWTDSERLLYSACIFYLLDHCDDEGMKNFSSVLKMINSSKVDEQGKTMEKSPLDRLFDVLAEDSLAKKYYTAFCQSPSRTRMSIIISCLSRLQPFMIRDVISLTSSDSINLNRICEEKTALFLITPSESEHPYNFLASMLYSQLFDTLYSKGLKKGLETGSERLPYPVRCMMDEFPNIGQIPGFPGKISTMRKYGISVSIVIQNLSQLQSLYKDDWQTIAGNVNSTLFLGTQAQDSLKYYSEQLGKKTITAKSRGMSRNSKNAGSSKNLQQTGREVMTPEELSRLPRDECIVFTTNLRPIRDKKYKGVDHPLWKQTGSPKYNPGALYKFQLMDEYDNEKIPEGTRRNLMDAIKAADAFRVQEELKEEAGLDIDGLLRSLVIPVEEEEILKSVLLSECLQKGAGLYDAPVNALRLSVMEKVSPGYLPYLAMETAVSFGFDDFLLFIDNMSGWIYGYGIDLAGGNRLYRAMRSGKDVEIMDMEDGSPGLYVKVAAGKYTDYISRLKLNYGETA